MSESNDKPTTGTWVSMADREPWREGTYIVLCEAGVLAMEWDEGKYMTRPKRQWKYHGRNTPWEVTHWMTLPANPIEK